MDKPLIGVTTYLTEARWREAWAVPAALLPAAYPAWIHASGGVAVMLPPGDPATAHAALGRLDGLVITGGEDLDPALYGAESHPRTGAPVRERDNWERALLSSALERDIPVLGICRGLQLMNVHAGGTLIQHLPDEVGDHAHNPRPGVFAGHLVTPVPGTRLAGLLPEAVEVATHHHQAVACLGEGVVATAYAEDGTVEALELVGPGFALGVQWHPEVGDDLRLGEALLAAARSRAQRSVSFSPLRSLIRMV